MPVPSIIQGKEFLVTATDEGLEELFAAVAPLTAKVIPALVARAREALTEQGARTLLAIADYDEALMYARRGDAETARPLLEQARAQFETIGMNGWIRRADELASHLKPE